MSKYPSTRVKPLAKIINPKISIYKNIRIGIVYSQFNAQITDKILERTINNLKSLGISAQNIICEKVSGALEIPVGLLWCEKYCNVSALIAIGCVIRGETFHFEIVSQTSAQALSNLALQTNIPVINGILTVDTEKQAKARILPISEHIATAAINMASLKSNLKDNKKVKKKIAIIKNQNEKTS